jgi:glycosyltransferase involved in cell wall biosynthesis
MKLSVILPCYNGADTIAVQLEALTKQSWASGWEVLVVNNGSTDESMAIVEQYRERLPELKIIEAYYPNEGAAKGRRGVAHSYTVGFKAATGDAFVLCEADDQVASGWLEAMGRALATHEFVAAAMEYAQLNEAWLIGDGQLTQSPTVGLLANLSPLYLPYASGCSFGLRRSVYQAVGNPDEVCGAAWDTDYCWRAHYAGIDLQFVPEAVVHYRFRPTLMGRYRQARNWAEAHIVLERKYGVPLSSFKLLKRFVWTFWALFRHLLQLALHLHSQKRFSDWVGIWGWWIGELRGSFKLLNDDDAVISFQTQDQTQDQTQVLKGVR